MVNCVLFSVVIWTIYRINLSEPALLFPQSYLLNLQTSVPSCKKLVSTFLTPANSHLCIHSELNCNLYNHGYNSSAVNIFVEATTHLSKVSWLLCFLSLIIYTELLTNYPYKDLPLSCRRLSNDFWKSYPPQQIGASLHVFLLTPSMSSKRSEAQLLF